jgi:hypothetical protein
MGNIFTMLRRYVFFHEFKGLLLMWKLGVFAHGRFGSGLYKFKRLNMKFCTNDIIWEENKINDF